MIYARAWAIMVGMTTNALPTKTDSRKTNKPCRRCKGTGQFSRYGDDTRCFRCKGDGREVETFQRPLTTEEAAQLAEYNAGMAARRAREAAREAGREERRARREAAARRAV